MNTTNHSSLPQDQVPANFSTMINNPFQPAQSPQQKKSFETGEALWAPPINKMVEEEEDDEEEGEFEVEEILDKKVKKGTPLYLVKWKGFSIEEATWEPPSNLENCPLLLQEFERTLALKKEKKTPDSSAKGQAAKNTSEKKREVKQNGTNLIPKIDNGIEKGNLGKGISSVDAVETPEAILGKRPISTENKEVNEIENKIKKVREEKNEIKPSEARFKKMNKEEMKTTTNENKIQPLHKEDDLTSKLKKLNSEDNKKEEVLNTSVPTGASNKSQSDSSYGKKNDILKGLASKITTLIAKEQDKSNDEITQNPAKFTTNPSQINTIQPQINNLNGSNIKNAAQEKLQTAMEIEKSTAKEGVSIEGKMQEESQMESSEDSKNATPQHDQKMKGAAGSTTIDPNNTKIKRKKTGELGSLEKGDEPLKVIGIRPVKEENDLEIMISWKARENGVKPQNSKVMRIDLLRKGFWLPLIEFYESKMKLESAPHFDSNLLPKY